MAEIKISELAPASAAFGAMELEVNNNGTSEKVTVDQVDNLLLGTTNGLVARTDTNTRAARTVTAGTGIIVSNGNGVSGNPTIAADVGTTANKLVQLDGDAKLPAVDGSLLTNLAGANADFQEFTSSGTWTKPAGAQFVYVEGVGGGGAGGRRSSAGLVDGGDGGVFNSKLLLAADLAATVAVTVGAGPAGRSTNGNGANGGTTTFGSHLTCPGGDGGNTTARTGVIANIPKYGSYNQGWALMNSATPQLYDSIKGGGAGGSSNQTSSFGPGGVSQDAGNGGAGGSSGDASTAGDGQAPGGGGGAGHGINSGAGANGRLRVWAWG